MREDHSLLKQQLGLDTPPSKLEAQIHLTLDEASRKDPLFAPQGLCAGYPLRPMPKHFFLAQEFGPDREDLRDSLAVAFHGYGIEPVCADDFFWPGHILCKASALIRSTPFGVYQLSVSQNRNVHLELGIALGAGRPFLLIRDRDAEIAPLLLGLDHVSADSFAALRYRLGSSASLFLSSLGSYQSRSPRILTSSTVAVSCSSENDIDFAVTVAKGIAETGLTPVFVGVVPKDLDKLLSQEGLSGQTASGVDMASWDTSMDALASARFGIFRVDRSAVPNSFLCLGAALALGRPGLLIHRLQEQVPSDLKGLTLLAFRSFSHLEELLRRPLSFLASG